MIRYGDGGVSPRTNAHAAGGGKRMPMKTQKQRGAMYAAARGDGTLGIPRRVAQRSVNHDESGRLPKRAPRRRNGLMSRMAK